LHKRLKMCACKLQLVHMVTCKDQNSRKVSFRNAFLALKRMRYTSTDCAFLMQWHIVHMWNSQQAVQKCMGTRGSFQGVKLTTHLQWKSSLCYWIWAWFTGGQCVHLPRPSSAEERAVVLWFIQWHFMKCRGYIASNARMNVPVCEKWCGQYMTHTFWLHHCSLLLLSGSNAGKCRAKCWYNVLHTLSSCKVLLVSMSIQSGSYVCSPVLLLLCALAICLLVNIISCEHFKDWFQKAQTAHIKEL
jgi:hypothetical protein